jgi:hypothetical protein
MSPRSIYFRDQADACWRLAILLTDAETKEQLRELAVELIERAAEIEGKGDDAPTPNSESCAVRIAQKARLTQSV